MMSSGLRLCFAMYSCSLAVSSLVIGKGGRGLQPLVILAVTVFWSVWMSLACSPFSPVTSMGLSPVWADMSSLMDSSSLADETRVKMRSCVGGCMVMGSGV